MKKNSAKIKETANFFDRLEALKRIPEFFNELGMIKDLRGDRDSIEIMFSDEYLMIKKMDEEFKKKWDIKFTVDSRGVTVSDITKDVSGEETSVKLIPFQEAGNNVSYLRDGRYVKFLVDVTVEKEKLLNTISDLIAEYQNISQIQGGKITGRKKSKKHDQWDVYDKINEKNKLKGATLDKAICSVAEDLYGKPGKPGAVEKIRSAYNKAESLIQQEEKNAKKRCKQKR